MSEAVKDYPPYLDYPKPKKKQTNADKIRAMTDEEMANWITRHTECEDWQCPVFHSCKEAYALDEYENPLCQDMILNWLKQEVSE